MDPNNKTCCADLATSRTYQLLYIAVMVLVLCLTLANAIISTVVDADDMPDIIGSITIFITLTAGITMTVSRCCIPACCSNGMDATPKPCPPTCFVCLDCPYIGLAVWLFIVALLNLFVGEGGGNSRILRLFRIVPLVLAIAALVAAIKKAYDMNKMKNDLELGHTTASTPAAVVGTPVQTVNVTPAAAVGTPVQTVNVTAKEVDK